MSECWILHDATFNPELLRQFFPSFNTVCISNLNDKPSLSAGCTVVFALPNSMLRTWTATYRNSPINNAYVYPYSVRKTGLAPIAVDLSKPRLDYFETELSENCNLNCRGCCDFSNLINGKHFYHFEQYIRDLYRLKDLFWGVEKIRLMGGEPLLNPRLVEYVQAAREIFPDSDLRIVSNGLLIPELSNDTLHRIREADCSFDISNYPPTRKRKKAIDKTLRIAEIDYNLGFPMDFFFRNLRVSPTSNPAPAFNNCIFTHCHMLGKGHLAPCSYAYCTYRFNERFGTSYPETDHVDLYHDTPDGWEIMRRFSAPHEFCRYCGCGIVPIRWKGNCRGDEPKPTDWQITPSFWNLKVLPVVQHILKPVTVHLRARLQKKE